MSFINEYKYILIPIFTWFLIQLYKFFSESIINKKIDFKRLLGAGGMPSSHSAVVTSLATIIGKNEGVNSAIFGLSIIFAFIVMYDATGVRRAAGKQAKVLNQIVKKSNLNGVEPKEKLVEVLGHTPLQVIIGAVVGIVIGLLF